jgi:hypothetical protein
MESLQKESRIMYGMDLAGKDNQAHQVEQALRLLQYWGYPQFQSLHYQPYQ